MIESTSPDCSSTSRVYREHVISEVPEHEVKAVENYQLHIQPPPTLDQPKMKGIEGEVLDKEGILTCILTGGLEITHVATETSEIPSQEKAESGRKKHAKISMKNEHAIDKTQINETSLPATLEGGSKGNDGAKSEEDKTKVKESGTELLVGQEENEIIIPKPPNQDEKHAKVYSKTISTDVSRHDRETEQMEEREKTEMSQQDTKPCKVSFQENAEFCGRDMAKTDVQKEDDIDKAQVQKMCLLAPLEGHSKVIAAEKIRR